MELLTFFSSDARPLYKADAFRVLALPEGYTVQFRYEKRYVAPGVTKLIEDEGILKKEGVVIFVSGNDPDKQVETKDLSFHPLRLVEVKDADFDPELEHYVFVLKLGAFVDIPDLCLREVNSSMLPQKTYVGPLHDFTVNPSTWYQRAQLVKAHFKGSPLYSIGVRKLGSRFCQCVDRLHTVTPEYIPHWRISEYQLREESDYILVVRYYDPHCKGGTPLIIKSDAIELNIENPFERGSGASVEVRRLAISTSSLEGNTAPAFVHFTSTGICSPDSAETKPAQIPTAVGSGNSLLYDNLEVKMRWRLVRKPWKTWWMGLLAGCGASAIVLGQLSLKIATDRNGNWNQSGLAVVFAVVAVVLGGISAAQLYRTFNKT